MKCLPIILGYARCSLNDLDADVQLGLLAGHGIPADRIYLDRGHLQRHGARPALQQVLSIARAGDTLVVPSMSRLAQSLSDAVDIGRRLARKGVALSFKGMRYDPATRVGIAFLAMLADVAEFEMDLVRLRIEDCAAESPVPRP